jgi:hypothetical protein
MSGEQMREMLGEKLQGELLLVKTMEEGITAVG